jgi:enediyne biosynthesis protein E4
MTRRNLALLLLLLSGCRPGTPTQTQTVAVTPATAQPALFQLTEVAQSRGVQFQHTHGGRKPLTIVETMGSGCAFFDYDNDGWQDIFFVNAGQDFLLPRQTPGSKLFHNEGNGNYREVTAESGIVIDGYAMGVCVGDYDNDGKDDLFVSGYGQNWLFHNEGNGKFKDVTQSAGIPKRKGAWGTGSAFLDVNRDGKLDLYVANYILYDPKIPLCRTNNTMHGCTPNQYKTQRNELYMNLGGGKFADKAIELGADDPNGAGLGVVVCDFDNDGWSDIFVANDGTPNALLHNKKGKFESIAQVAGVAYGEDGGMRAGMGTDAADYNGDGKMDLVVTNFRNEPNSLYRNVGDAAGLNFQDVSFADGTGTPCLSFLKFGVVFADLDGDGRQDLYIGNGHVYDNVQEFDASTSFEQRDQILQNVGGRFEEVLPESGAFPSTASVARAVAAGDYNNDGMIDLLINSVGRPGRLLENKHRTPGKWLGVKLRGTRSSRSAIGSRVELRAPDSVQVREVRSGGSYLAQSDLRVLFNLGTTRDTAKMTLFIRWASGKTQTLPLPALNQYTEILEPNS